MKFKLSGLTSKNKTIELPKPIWFEFLINNYGTNIKFKFTFLKPIPDIVTHLEIQIDEKPTEIFIVDQIKKIVHSNKLVTFNLVASSQLSLIWQNYVKPETFEKLTIDELFEKFCKPFKIESINVNLKNYISNSFFTTLGMTYWDTICIFFQKNFNATIFINENKQITTKFKTTNPINFKMNDPYLCHFENLTDRTKIISTIMVQLPNDKSDYFRQLNQTDYFSEQLNINRTKFFKLPKQFAMLPHSGAKAIVDQQNAQHKIVKLEFAKVLKPIYPGSVIKLTDGSEIINLCVISFYTTIYKNGHKTIIECLYSDLVN